MTPIALLIRRPPWSPRAWRQTLYLTGGVPALLVVPGLVVAGFAAKPRWALPLAFLVAAFFAAPLLTWIQRHRLRTTAGVDIPPVRRPRGVVAIARSESWWRQYAYHLLAAPLLAAGAVAGFALWLTGAMFSLVYAYGWRLHPGSVFSQGDPRLASPIAVPVDALVTVGGVLALFAAPWAVAGVAALDARVARQLLGPSRAEELQSRVERLTETRAGVVDAADAERRRLERDLHDGTQQRLVSLAMNLGMARAEATTVAEAREEIVAAHEQAKAALVDLRNLVRGLHPPVLEDRGLDAALSGVAARMPIPVRLTVDVPRRPSPTVEAVAYFVVSEGLTNIAKHAQASQAEVFVQRAADRLHIIVTDDGVGGADPVRGTGLTGLARRAESVDGTFDINSPPGGPTLLTVDLPC